MKSPDGKGHIPTVVEVLGFMQDWGATTMGGSVEAGEGPEGELGECIGRDVLNGELRPFPRRPLAF
uniref:Uncharacterized protein n=2 Tax=Candidatus Bipolaricaulota TaxID=67810 RepID=H5SNH1_9BACT|nr:hypothetical protein HGMM_F52A12C27 [uncultured Acetothermia bacterium]BAL59391.1 hypothetical protein HGMM_OP4C027 [Candidatus Acetothermum autotrophicum]